MPRDRSVTSVFFRLAFFGLLVGQMVGCQVDSFMDPSVTGYWESTPHSMPILDRIAVIETEGDLISRATPVSSEDLIPSDLAYIMGPGDFVSIAVQDLFTPGLWERVTRRVDAGGFIRAPALGDVQAAGFTPQELENALWELYNANVITNPQVEVVVEEGSAFQYTVYGAVPAPGLYTLRNPDLRLLDALAAAGGASPSIIKSIYVIRSVGLTDDVQPFSDVQPPNASDGQPTPPETVDIDDLINELDNNAVSPGAFQDDPPVDIDAVSPDSGTARSSSAPRSLGAWVFVEGEWQRVAPGSGPRSSGGAADAMYAERVIKVPLEALSNGDSRYNIVIRPDDRIYVKAPDTGVIYIEGQILRPGVYTMPINGELTLSRVVAAAGGLGQLAIPDRIDLVRRIGTNREAVVRLNLAAIRQRTEPDVLLRADDHIIIGTNFFATPLAVIRNGLRATYGFGFLLDRNFGNDVFGAPPTNRFGN